MRKAIAIMVAAMMVVTFFAVPDSAFAASKAPAKVKASTIKVAVVNSDSLKISWGKAKRAKSYQVQYKVAASGNKSAKWKTLKKSKKKRYHVYKGTKGVKYTVWVRVRAINGKKHGKWSAASKAKAKKFVKTIPAFTPKYASFSPSFSQFSENRSITVQDYLNTQGCAFDTYTRRDGYNFTFDSVNGGNDGAMLVHFNVEDNGIVKVGEAVRYDVANIGHANDGTIYSPDGDKKYLFVAISGGKEKSSRDSSGRSIKLGYINLDEYDQGKAVVHGVDIDTNGVKTSSALSDCAFSGITYTGKRNVSGASREVFVLKDGRTFYAAYLTISGSNLKLTFFDSARIVKPTITYGGNTYDATTQGITYHNGYIYVPYSGEANKLINCNMLIGRITYADLFRDAYSDLRNLQIWSKRVDKATVPTPTETQTLTLAKHVPEALFFRTLEGSDNMYLSVNRGTTATSGSDVDAVLKSKETY